MGSGEITSAFEVAYKVRGILHPYPKCDVEHWIEEVRGDQAEIRLEGMGQELVETMRTVELIPMITDEMSSDHIIIPMSQTELIVYSSQPALDFVDTFTIDLRRVPKFIGCIN